jgi:hypothetical protein
VIRHLVQSIEFRQHLHRGTVGLLLDQIEEAAAVTFVICDLLGIPLRPVEPPGGRRVEAPG